MTDTTYARRAFLAHEWPPPDTPARRPADEIVHVVSELYHLIETLDFRLCCLSSSDDEARALLAEDLGEIERLVGELRRLHGPR